MADSHFLRILKLEMDRRKLNRHSLAVEAGLQDDAIRNLFREASSMPRVQTLQALAKFFGVTIDYLVEPQPASLEDGPLPRMPVQKPGALEWQELQRLWDAASEDGRKALVYQARMIAKAEGVSLEAAPEPHPPEQARQKRPPGKRPGKTSPP